MRSSPPWQNVSDPTAAPPLPPLVLVISADRDALALVRALRERGYRAVLRRWPSSVAELTQLCPRLIVVDMTILVHEPETRFVQGLRRHEATATIPLFLTCLPLSSLGPERLRQHVGRWVPAPF